jgi:hypothetical protein
MARASREGCIDASSDLFLVILSLLINTRGITAPIQLNIPVGGVRCSIFGDPSPKIEHGNRRFEQRKIHQCCGRFAMPGMRV